MKYLNLTTLGLLLVASISVKAAPYATDLSNSGGTISFRLNEAADNVKIVANGGAVTHNLGALGRGVFSTNLSVSGVFQVVVTRSAPAGYTQLSSDSFQDQGVYVNKFEQPRGLAVNKNPATPSFGRIFIANSRVASTASPIRETKDGIYALNSDNTIALDTGIEPRTAGLDFATGGTGSPNRMQVGNDGNLYVCDFSDASGGLWVMDLDVTTGTNVLDVIGDLGYGATTHGSTYGVAIDGSLAGSNLKIFTIDEDMAPARSVWSYDIGAGPLPHTGSPTGPLSTAPIANFTGDLAKGGVSNYLYFTQNRSSGTETDGPGVRIFTADGTAVTNSQAATRAHLNNPTAADFYRNVLAIDISPDGKTLALLQGSSFGRILLVPLTNGIFNFAAATNVCALGAGGFSENNRDVAFDAAGNLYAINTASEWFRIYSRGGATVATTGSDGTFDIGVPATLVTASAATATADEQGSAAGVFTLTRSGDTSGALTVNYSISGTASNGVDYAQLTGSVTFAAGATSTNISVVPVDDSVAEFSETVVLTVLGGATYGAGTPTIATVTILDNEAPTAIIETVQGTLLEGYAPATATLKVSRLGLLTSALNVNISYSGATAGTHFNGASSVAINAGASSTNFNLTPINNTTYGGEKTITASIASGSYSIGTPASANVTLVDDEFPAGTVLFQDNFDVNNSANWSVYHADGSGISSAVDWAFDYSALGIPSAPRSSGGSTLGVKFRVNEDVNAGVVSGVSISPLSADFGSDYRLTFDSWINYNGPLAAGGRGSTQHASAGVGTSGTAAQWNSGFTDGVWFSWPGEGGVGAGTTGIRDINVYAPVTPESPTYASVQASDSGVYAAGTTASARDNDDPFYQLWGGLQAPLAQQTAYPGPTAGQNQTGTTDIGTLGFAWHNVTITKIGGNVTWAIDGITIATVNVDTNSFTLFNNISVGYEDAFSSVTDNTAVSFGLIDNLKVETYAAAPPAAPTLNYSRSGNNVTLTWSGSFTLQQASVLTGSPGDWSDVVGAVSGHSVSASSGNKFFRLRQ